MLLSYSMVMWWLSGPSTKDEAHQRRSRSNNIRAEVDFKPELLLTMKKEPFLTNPRNMQEFLYFIGSKLEKAAVELYHSAGDADYDIMSTPCTWPRVDQWQWLGTTPTCWSCCCSLHHLSPRYPVIFLRTASKILNIRQWCSKFRA